MRKSTLRGVLAGLVGLALLAGGLATASNMGFKFVPNIGANQAFNLSLPWNNNYTKANQLYNDLTAQGAGVSFVQKITTNSKFIAWASGYDPGNNFDVVKGEAYVVVASGAKAVNTAVIVGSHDPSFRFTFPAGQAKSVAAPYHQTLTKANQLFNDLTTKLGGSSISFVQKVLTNSKFIAWATGYDPGNNFDLTLGMGIVVVANTGGSNYQWPHY